MVLTEEGSISRNRRGQSLEEKQKGTEPRPISIIWAAAQGYFAPSCNAMQGQIMRNPIGYNETLRNTQYFDRLQWIRAQECLKYYALLK